MRVLYVLSAEGFGGAERQGLLHIDGLSRLGFEVIPLVGPGERICRALEAQGTSDYIYCHDLLHEHDGPISRWGRLRRKALAFGSWLTAQQRLARIALDRRVEIIVANRPFAWTAISPVAQRLGLPLVWRGGSRLVERQHALGLFALARLWPPDALLVNCEAVRRQLQPLVGARTVILPNGVDTERFDPARVPARYRAAVGGSPVAPVIGFVGRPHPGKGLDVLAEALRRTLQELPDARLLVAGEFGWRPHFEALFEALGLSDRARFLGHVEDIEALYQSCDVIALTSRERSIEGCPNAVLEAMAMARPVVATRVGGVAEAVHHGVNGFLAADGDGADIARHLARLLQDARLRARLGAAGQAMILARHSGRAVVEQLGELLVQIATRRGRSDGASGPALRSAPATCVARRIVNVRPEA